MSESHSCTHNHSAEKPPEVASAKRIHTCTHILLCVCVQAYTYHSPFAIMACVLAEGWKQSSLEIMSRLKESRLRSCVKGCKTYGVCVLKTYVSMNTYSISLSFVCICLFVTMYSEGLESTDDTKASGVCTCISTLHTYKHIARKHCRGKAVCYSPPQNHPMDCFETPSPLSPSSRYTLL